MPVIEAKSPLGEALAYIAKYLDGLKLVLTDAGSDQLF